MPGPADPDVGAARVATVADRCRADGYAVVPGLLPRVAVLALRDRARELTRAAGVTEAVERQVLDVPSTDPVFGPGSRHPMIADVLVGMLGPDVDWVRTQYRVEPPGSVGGDWHQDAVGVVPDAPGCQVGVLVVVTDDRPGEATLVVQPGSQEAGGSPSGEDSPLALHAGDVVFFDARLWQRPAGDPVGSGRAATVHHYARAGAGAGTRAVPVRRGGVSVLR